MPAGYYGTEDHVECLAPLHHPDPSLGFGAHPCLAYRFSVDMMGLPYAVHDNGYVITAEGAPQYIQLDADKIHQLQVIGAIDDKLPTYEIPIGWRLASYSAWLVLALILGVAAWKLVQRRRLARARDAGAGATGRVLDRAGDREIDAAFASKLEPAETITHQAYATDRVPDSMRASLAGRAHWLALTDRRLLMLTTKIGLFGLGRGTAHFRPITRGSITGIEIEHEKLFVRLDDGELITLIVPFIAARCSAANQRAFLTEVPRSFAGRLPEARIAR